MKPIVLDRGTSQNQSWFKAASVDIRCMTGTKILRKEAK
jgi:hypothetical protein